ncbi:hypothetical protein SAMN03159423_0207 [Bradyrhizobium sp. NFR13]|uniref:hypothetical protein n=1 Tax=Bradyrhizobium sp. NFR13 TaxID=1566285 RepID=UPI0008F052FD|nr:hypothetical protein [Bradyrhizobium sp. NFR13]SFM24530.1 hypothetical protein SAMN03159423_0207 [Bradyrhizobium sp. NFR13]
MKPADHIAAEVVEGLSFSSNRMHNGRLIGEQHFAFDAVKRAIELDRLHMAGSITMGEIRKHTGPGRIGYELMLWAVNQILTERARSSDHQ